MVIVVTNNQLFDYKSGSDEVPQMEARWEVGVSMAAAFRLGFEAIF